MRRRIVIVPALLLAGLLLARRRRRRLMRAAITPVATPPPPAAPIALLPPGARFVSVPWTLIESDPADARLRIRCSADEHMELDRVDAQETPTQVYVTALMRWQPPAEGVFAPTREHETVVTLSRPLGPRELVHTPVDVEVPGEQGSGQPSGPPLYP